MRFFFQFSPFFLFLPRLICSKNPWINQINRGNAQRALFSWYGANGLIWEICLARVNWRGDKTINLAANEQRVHDLSFLFSFANCHGWFVKYFVLSSLLLKLKLENCDVLQISWKVHRNVAKKSIAFHACFGRTLKLVADQNQNWSG